MIEASPQLMYDSSKLS